MARRALISLAGLVSLTIACSNGPNSADVSSPRTNSDATEQATSPNPPVFVHSGGCGEAFFWAANDDSTIALRIQTAVPTDRANEVVVDLSEPLGTLVELQHGTSLQMSLCGDITDDTYRLDVSVPAVSGTVTFTFGAGPARCVDGGYDGTAELDDVEFGDGTFIESLTVSTTELGCFAG